MCLEPFFAMPDLDIPISREGMSTDDLLTPSAAEFRAAQAEDAELQQLREWVGSKTAPLADEIAKFGARLKELAGLLNCICEKEGVLVLRADEDSTE